MPGGNRLLRFHRGSPGVRGGQFKRFPETISPDGAYALAWGPLTDPPANPAELSEVPYEDEAFDEAQPDSVANYLIDVATRKIVAAIPGFEYFRGPKWRKNRADLEIGWAPDAQNALAIYDGRWSSEAVVWIEPRAHKIVDVQKQLEEAFRKVLRKKEPKLAAEVSIYFNSAVIPRAGVLILNASGTIPKQDDTAAYRLKFKITGAGDTVQFHLQNARVIKEAYTVPGDDPEGELNKVYGQLRAKLPEARRAALRDEEMKWLKRREEITDDDCKTSFTNHRIVELRTLLKED
jgi:hypothetical protein